MKTIPVILFGLSLTLSDFAQDISVTFSAAGSATTIDSVTALNMRTNQSITFPGDATLVLKLSLGIQDIAGPSERLTLFPNPFSGDSKVVLSLSEPQKVNLRVQNLLGQVVAQTSEILQPGESEFALTVKENGLYTLVLETQEGFYSCKAICLSTLNNANNLRYLGGSTQQRFKSIELYPKTLKTGYSLDYSTGDVIHYTCYSGIMISIITDVTGESKNLEVEFSFCTDPDGKHYRTVKIGDQMWMAENLGWLPSVSPSNTGSENDKHYYVYAFEGVNTSEAKLNPNYATYGVLYNWEAAKTACPSGWHLPDDNEWVVLTDYLISHGFGHGGNGSDIGKSLASIFGWTISSNTGVVGNNQLFNNSSGFNALPGGGRTGGGGFLFLSTHANFWSSTPTGSSGAYYRGLFYSSDGLDRGYFIRTYGFSVRCIHD